MLNGLLLLAVVVAVVVVLVQEVLELDLLLYQRVLTPYLLVEVVLMRQLIVVVQVLEVEIQLSYQCLNVLPVVAVVEELTRIITILPGKVQVVPVEVLEQIVMALVQVAQETLHQNHHHKVILVVDQDQAPHHGLHVVVEEQVVQDLQTLQVILVDQVEMVPVMFIEQDLPLLMPVVVEVECMVQQLLQKEVWEVLAVEEMVVIVHLLPKMMVLLDLLIPEVAEAVQEPVVQVLMVDQELS